MLSIIKINESWLNIVTDDQGMHRTLYDYFAYFNPGYFFAPSYKEKRWDGKIHLYDSRLGLLPIGFFKKLLEFLDVHEVKYEVFNSIKRKGLKINKSDIKEWLIDTKSDLTLIPRSDQIRLVSTAIMKKRSVLVSPTASGKSLSLYLYIRFLIEKVLDEEERVLLIVPRIQLVEQSEKNFRGYSKNNVLSSDIQTIMGGKEKRCKKRIIISTWQSIYKFSLEYFAQFSAVLIDEVHYAKSDSFQRIMALCVNAKYRIGVTGSLSEWETHKVLIKAFLGEISRVETTKNLIEKKVLSNVKIVSLIIKYPVTERLIASRCDYREEIKYILNHRGRVKLIKRIVSKIDRNSLILFRYLKHGKAMYEFLKATLNDDRNIYYIDGSTPVGLREEIRENMEKEKDSIIVASSEVFSTGIDIKNLHFVIIATPMKGRIKVIQSIGRALRLHDDKRRAVIIDIVDDFRCKFKKRGGGKRTYKNHAYSHYLNRLKLYKEEEFDVIEKNIYLK